MDDGTTGTRQAGRWLEVRTCVAALVVLLAVVLAVLTSDPTWLLLGAVGAVLGHIARTARHRAGHPRWRPLTAIIVAGWVLAALVPGRVLAVIVVFAIAGE
jgi:hypothetical protein